MDGMVVEYAIIYFAVRFLLGTMCGYIVFCRRPSSEPVLLWPSVALRVGPAFVFVSGFERRLQGYPFQGIVYHTFASDIRAGTLPVLVIDV